MPEPSATVPTVSAKLVVISIYYNRSALVSSSVSSVVEQLDDDMHLLLVDDGSTDDTLAQLERWQRQNVTVRTQHNMGFVESIIQAIDGTDSEYIAIHGSGDLSLPGRFAAQRRVLDSDKTVGVVGCLSLQRSLNPRVPDHIFGVPFSGDARQRIAQKNLFTHGEVMMRRTVYEQVGGYRRYFKFAQDRDLWCRMSMVSHFHVLDRVLYERMIGVADSVTGNPSKFIFQRYFSNFAVHCHRERLAGCDDPLTRFGHSAAFIAVDPAPIRKELSRAFVRSIAQDQQDAAALFLRAYARESGSAVAQALMRGMLGSRGLRAAILAILDLGIDISRRWRAIRSS